ncbi:SpoIIE family protein phosphatase [Clostridium sp. WILCCON 0269]|uniref:SpoIIE family protein phosphatase n=1 Tax=Candidatus Clostridium eludens TaxID=3381663 RepID=A0ABW8SHG9_9CLOT
MVLRFKSIKVKYTLIGLAICLISLFVVSIFSYIVSYNITSDLSDKRVHEAVLRNSAEIDNWFNNHQSVIDSLSQDIEASGDFTSSHLLKLLQNKVKIHKDEVLDFYIAFEGNTPALISGVGWLPPSGYNATRRAWYEMARESDKVIFTEPYVDAMTGKLVITVAKVLKSNNKVIGVLAADIYLTEVVKVVGEAKVAENSYGVLLDNKGRIIAHPNLAFLPTKNGFRSLDEIHWKDYKTLVSTLFTKGINNKIELRDYNGKEEFFNFSRIDSNGWYFGIVINKSEYKKPLQKLLLGFGGAFLVSMFIAFFIMIKLMDTMIKPIRSLNNTVKDFSSDNMSVRTNVISEDEIGELSQSFNKMADIIQEYSRSLEKKVEERTSELEMKNQTIMESIEYARIIQNAIIPDIGLGLGIPQENCFSIWEPRDTVGGDVFWGKGDEDHALLAVADCTGHGVPGAFMSMMVNSILNAISREFSYDKPAEMLMAINARIKDALNQEQKDSKINDGADVALLYIDKKNKRLVFSGAKLNMFVLSSGNTQVVKGSKYSVGYSRGKDVHYENVEVPYIKGGVYYFTTDGFLDQNYEKNKGGMGRRGFISLIESIYHLPMEKQRNIIEYNIKEKLCSVPQRDDITVIGLKL